MRVAVVSDIHGNLTAFEAVLTDIQLMSPDLILHGGDLADSGSMPTEVIDLIRDLGWPGVMGNTDEMLVRPESLENFASNSSAPAELWKAVREISSATRTVLGTDRLAWLGGLAMKIDRPGFSLVHASPGNCWWNPPADAADAELQAVYGVLEGPIVAFGHTHRASIRSLTGRLKMLLNTGSVGLPYDGDPRSSYLLLDGETPTIRRVEYDLGKELRALALCDLPGAEWTSMMLRTSAPQMP